MPERVGLKDRMHHKPNRCPADKAEGGYCKGSVNDPAIILADEPTVTKFFREEIMAVFQGLNREGVTIVLVTHELDIAQHTNRIVSFRDGILMSDVKVERPLDARDMKTEVEMEVTEKGNGYNYHFGCN